MVLYVVVHVSMVTIVLYGSMGVTGTGVMRIGSNEGWEGG